MRSTSGVSLLVDMTDEIAELIPCTYAGQSITIYDYYFHTLLFYDWNLCGVKHRLREISPRVKNYRDAKSATFILTRYRVNRFPKKLTTYSEMLWLDKLRLWI